MDAPKANEYLRFERLDNGLRKTEVWGVFASRDGQPLGLIRWFGRWRQYAFEPEPNSVFNPGCLDTIAENIRWLMAQRAIPAPPDTSIERSTP